MQNYKREGSRTRKEKESQRPQISNLLDEVLLLVIELRVIGSVSLEALQESYQLVPILEENHPYRP